MQLLELGLAGKKSPTVLMLGAHCDDIEIGCGGTILKLLGMYPQLNVHWVVFSSNSVREKEAQHAAETFLAGANSKTIVVKNFRNGYFPFVGADIKDYFEQIKQQVLPDVVFTHFRNDLHQDHRVISNLAWNTFRDHLLLEYEIMKYDGDIGNPNFFVTLDESYTKRKIDYLFECFESQKDKQWFTEDTFASLMRLRGIEANAPGRYAEAFYVRKISI